MVVELLSTYLNNIFSLGHMMKKDVLFDTFKQKKHVAYCSEDAHTHDNYTISASYSFNGKEKDYESGFHYYGARYYWSELLTGWLSVDPMIDKYPSISPYAYCALNPVKLVDPDGNDISTHTDEDGNVIKVYNDGDNRVFKHNGDREYTKKELQDKYSSSNTSAGGQLMGETAYWDEFMSHNSQTGTPQEAMGRIRFGETWDGIIDDYNKQSRLLGLEATALLSLPNGRFDIKNNRTLAPDGTHTGKLLNGKYASAESAGNYLAGMNGASGTTILGIPVSRDVYMFMAGALHSSQNGSAVTNKYKGEIPYAGRRIDAGFQNGRKNLQFPIVRPLMF